MRKKSAKRKPKGNPDPEFWGYDPKCVPETHCLVCDLPIGFRPYKENTILGRFGQMLFTHVDCVNVTDRILEALDSHEKGLRSNQVADKLKIDRDFVKHMFKTMRKNGDIEPCPITKRWRRKG